LPLLVANREFLNAVDIGVPCTWKPENMLHSNSKQVIYAERFDFSENDDVDLVRQMIEKDSNLKTGPRGRAD
jgi:hypothetical protein